MSALATKLRTYRALGIANLARVAAYRGRLKLRLFEAEPRILPGFRAPFFTAVALPPIAAPVPSTWQGEGLMFGYHGIALDGVPDWLANPLTGAKFPGSERPWFAIGDFDPAFGDIKLVWEYSRLGWMLPMAARARNGDAGELQRLNLWIEDWSSKNPPYRGPNWKCGQEASIRVMHLAMVAQILGQAGTPAESLIDLVETHLPRIAPTLAYARAQDNNHGTSEAAALFIGGSWLAAQGRPGGANHARIGRRLLEERVARLVAPDGSFSQHSVTYHRLLLDTLSMVEIWRRALDLPAFSDRFHARARAAADWLRNLIFGEDGDAPNLGANDGAQLLPLADTPYRDFRPSCQLATQLFAGKRAFAPGAADALADWFSIPLAAEVEPEPASQRFDFGGYATLRGADAAVLMRYPRFRFRPSQADAMHVDLWVGGAALLRDGGTYSYNDGDEWLARLGGVAGHNTVQFDGKEQMPRLGRFLLGDWLNADVADGPWHKGEAQGFTAQYRSRDGWTHRRALELRPNRLMVRDDVAGFRERATLRWRMAPGDWTLDGSTAKMGGFSLRIDADVPIELRLEKGYESRRYHEVTEAPILVVEVRQPGTIFTEIEWSA